MTLRFDGLLLFGVITRQSDTTGRRRYQEEHIPGVAGSRIYDLGPESNDWTVRGRVIETASTFQGALQKALAVVERGISYKGNGLYLFEDTAGKKWRFCLLAEYKQVGEFQPCVYRGLAASTAMITATVRQVLPGA